MLQYYLPHWVIVRIEWINMYNVFKYYLAHNKCCYFLIKGNVYVCARVCVSIYLKLSGHTCPHHLLRRHFGGQQAQLPHLIR